MKNKELKLAKNKAYKMEEKLKSDLEKKIITEEEWFKKNKEIFTGLYLSSGNPRSQSGHGGDKFHYANSHSIILQAINRNGTFIDVGCANGYLIESLKKWTISLGFTIEFYGLDISEGLIELAKRRLPAWKDKLFLGNALFWKPEKKFDYVLIKELLYVPKYREIEFIKHLLTNYVKSDGRFIIGPYSIEKNNYDLTETFNKAGYTFTGYVERSHYRFKELCKRMYWIDMKEYK